MPSRRVLGRAIKADSRLCDQGRCCQGGVWNFVIKADAVEANCESWHQGRLWIRSSRQVQLLGLFVTGRAITGAQGSGLSVLLWEIRSRPDPCPCRQVGSRFVPRLASRSVWARSILAGRSCLGPFDAQQVRSGLAQFPVGRSILARSMPSGWARSGFASWLPSRSGWSVGR